MDEIHVLCCECGDVREVLEFDPRAYDKGRVDEADTITVVYQPQRYKPHFQTHGRLSRCFPGVLNTHSEIMCRTNDYEVSIQ